MKYDHHAKADETNRYDALGDLSGSEFPAIAASQGWLGDLDIDGDAPFATSAVSNARLEMHVECWGRRLA